MYVEFFYEYFTQCLHKTFHKIFLLLYLTANFMAVIIDHHHIKIGYSECKNCTLFYELFIGHGSSYSRKYSLCNVPGVMALLYWLHK